jgi:ribonucleoside-triphosphate reductase
MMQIKKQEAQYLIFSCSQSAFSRGGQTLFIDFNVHLGIPSYLKNVPAIGSGGNYALSSARALVRHSSLSALDIVKERS